MNEVHNEMKENKFSIDVKSFLNKFDDVFLDEIEDLSVVREIDYATDLVANVAPIDKIPWFLYKIVARQSPLPQNYFSTLQSLF